MTPRERMLAVWQELAERRALLGAGLGVLVGAIIALILILSHGHDHHGASTVNTVPAPVPTTVTPTVTAPAPAPKRRHTVSRAKAQPKKPAKTSTTGGAAITTGTTTSRTTTTSSSTSTTTAASGGSTVTLVLHGGGNASLSACGETHHYRTYAAGSPVTFSGTVKPVPGGHWKVKLRIKVCQGQTFTDFAKIPAQKGPSGAFSGSFNAPAKGDYAARAVLYVNGMPRAESSKRHFATH